MKSSPAWYSTLAIAAFTQLFPFAGELAAQEAKREQDSSAHSPVGGKINVILVEKGGTGPHPAVASENSSLPGMTIFSPRDLVKFGEAKKLPVLLWGNGACANTTFEHKNFLSEIASHGYLVLAIGLLNQINERGEGSRLPTRPAQLIEALNWAEKQNQSADSPYFGKLAVDHVAAMGMSCGGLQAIAIAADPRLDALVICNSGWNDGMESRTPTSRVSGEVAKRASEVITPAHERAVNRLNEMGFNRRARSGQIGKNRVLAYRKPNLRAD